MSGVAFVMGGGGSHGAVQVGMARALQEFGVVPDVLIGASVGAVNAAVLAQGFSAETLDSLTEKWLATASSPPFRISIARLLRAGLGREVSLLASQPLTSMLDAQLSYRCIEDAAIRLGITATDLFDGSECTFTRGPVLTAVAASCAVPGFFPPVEIDGRHYIDGLLYGSPLSSPILQACRDVFILSSARLEPLQELPRSWWGVARHAATAVMLRHLNSDSYASKGVRVWRLPSVQQTKTISRRDFQHSATLMAEARNRAIEWLESTSRFSGTRIGDS